MNTTGSILKKVIYLIVVSLVLFTPVMVLAESNRVGPVDGTDYAEVTKEIAYDYQGFSGAKEARDTDILESIRNPDKSDVSAHNSFKVLTRASWYQLDNMSSFIYFAQEKYYSCGPACVKMALRYIKGVTYAELTIRSGCNTTTSGTYLSNMKTYINSKQNSNTYITKYGVAKSTMKNNLYTGIVTYDSPPIMGLKETINNGWPFNLGAHFVVFYAIKSDKSEVSIADPWAGYVSSNSIYKHYDKTTDDVYTAYNSVNCGYMY